MKKLLNKKILLSLITLLFVAVFIYCIGVLTGFVKITSDPESDVKISVIIPVYNTEKYLDECLNSVQNQTFKDIEIICVNDGSTDNSLQILEEHQKQDDRIKIINQENSGVSVARNAGIDVARGDYIAFLDSDDYLATYAYEKAYKNAIDNKVEIVQFNSYYFEDGESVNLANYSYDDNGVYLKTRDKEENPFEKLTLNADVVWNKLWSRSFIIRNRLYFKPGIALGEDSLFVWLSGSYIYSMVNDTNMIYFRRCDRPGSAMAVNNRTIEKRLENFMKIIYELAVNRNTMNFEDRDEYILSTIMHLCYFNICNLENVESQKYYAKTTLHIIEDEFLNRYGITLSSKYKEKVDYLKSLV